MPFEQEINRLVALMRSAGTGQARAGADIMRSQAAERAARLGQGGIASSRLASIDQAIADRVHRASQQADLFGAQSRLGEIQAQQNFGRNRALTMLRGQLQMQQLERQLAAQRSSSLLGGLGGLAGLALPGIGKLAGGLLGRLGGGGGVVPGSGRFLQ